MIFFWIGIALMLVGISFRWYAIWVLGRFFSTKIITQPGHIVVDRGPYRYIRHPSYTGAIVTFLGFGIVLSNWLSLGVVLLCTSLGYGYRVFKEEHFLIEGLGQPYREYMKRTKRFVPFLI